MLTITPENIDGVLILKFTGRFEFVSRKVFWEAFKKVQETPNRHVIMDLEHVPFVDSSAIGLLALTHQNLKLQNVHLSIANPQEPVKKVLDLANFSKFIPMYSSLQEAMRSTVLV